jgi:hypothetical protein
MRKMEWRGKAGSKIATSSWEDICWVDAALEQQKDGSNLELVFPIKKPFLIVFCVQFQPCTNAPLFVCLFFVGWANAKSNNQRKKFAELDEHFWLKQFFKFDWQNYFE